MRGESPFQFRRSRIDASVRRYDRAVRRAHEAAHRCLERDTCFPEAPRRTGAAVERMSEILAEEHAAGPDGLHRIDVVIDLLGNTLANLGRSAECRPVAHPFR